MTLADGEPLLPAIEWVLGIFASLACAAAAVAYLRLRRRFEALRERQSRSEADIEEKSKFLAHVSHEIRTPLNGIVGLAQLLAGKDLDPSEEQKIKSMLLVSCHQLMDLVNDVLTISKIQAGKGTLLTEDFLLKNWAESILFPLKNLAKHKGLSLQLSFVGDSRLKAHADVGKMGQILANLVSNAIKFTERGRVDVRVWCPDKTPGTLVVMVEDTGIGIDSNLQARLFQRFMRADSLASRFGGTGLGLYIVAQLLDLLGGRVSVSSRVGEGSVFRVEFPLQAPQGQIGSDYTQMAAWGVGAPGLRCLVADDNPTNQFVLRRSLEKLGCFVVSCSDGIQALDLVEREGFDIVFMDCEMPEIDGFEATRRIRQRHASADLWVVAVTAGVGPEDRRRCLASGMNEYLPKPFALEQLRSVLSQFEKQRRRSA